jgi:hypothetical protein
MLSEWYFMYFDCYNSMQFSEHHVLQLFCTSPATASGVDIPRWTETWESGEPEQPRGAKGDVLQEPSFSLGKT